MRGPIGPNFVSSYNQGVQTYGLPNPQIGYMLDSAYAFLLESTSLWMDRVVSADVTYGLGLLSNNTIGGNAAGTNFTTMPAGSQYDYTQVNRDVQDIEFTGLFVSGSVCTITINSVSGTVVNFATDHNTTINAVAQSIQTVLDGLAGGGLAYVVPLGTNYPIIRVISPEAIVMTISAVITGAGAPTSNIYEADWLAFVVAENPGSWSAKGNSYGQAGIACGITNVDVGTPQRVQLSFSGALLINNVVTATINGTTFSATFDGTTNATNNDTLTALCAAYTTAFPGATAAVTNANNGTSGNRIVTLIAPDSATILSISALAVTLGVTQATITYTVTLNNTPSTNGFNFVVYESFTFAQPTELYSCTFANGIDGLGNPTGFEYVINTSANASPRVKVKVNPLFSGTVNAATQPVCALNTACYLGGGSDGSLPSTAQVVNGWADFANTDQVTVRILINGGYATPEVHQCMLNLAAARMDCISVLDMPSDQQTPAAAVNYRQNVMNISSFWGAIYSPDILIYDSQMGARRYVPPSGLVACQYAYTDKVAAAWWAPAGLTRGLINTALALRVTYVEGDRDLMSAAQVNCIRKFGAAFTIWGEYTLQQEMSALQSVPVVRLIIIVVTESVNVCAYSVFEPNNPFTWHTIQTVENAILQPIEDAMGITDFYVQCDATNNTPQVIDQRVCKVALWIKPTLSILYIQLDVVVTRQSATFTIEMAAANGMY